MSKQTIIFPFFVLLFHTVLTENDNTRVVNIAQGPVRGYLDPTGGVYAFYNIPYATAPTGTDKFKAPLEPPTWENTFEAVDRQIVCPQPGVSVIQEDCLVANIFIPDSVETNLPVVVLIHGGRYQYNYGNSNTMNVLVNSKKIIVVTFNYRLGAHGFLCLGTEGAPGNAGLKDQVAVLRWVNTNIANFGGNPDDVTVIGCSAGGGSTDILTLSKLTTGLIKKAIIESGAAFGAVGAQSEPVVNAQNYARILNFEHSDDLEALEQFYKTIPFEQLYSRDDIISGNLDARILFGPCVERDVGEERVLEDAPLNIIKTGNYNKIPLIYGFTNLEGVMRMPYFDTWKDMMNDKFSDFLPAELYFENEEDKENVADVLKTFYFGNNLVGETTFMNYVDYFTDVLFGYPVLFAIKARTESLGDTIYLHEYSFEDENSSNLPHTDERGALHCDQTRAVFDQDKSQFTIEYIRMKAIMREYWSNFILTGSPSTEQSGLVSWPPTGSDRSPHMSLGATVQLKGILLEDRAALWDGIYEQYYRAPKPPAGSDATTLMISNVMITISLFVFYTMM